MKSIILTKPEIIRHIIIWVLITFYLFILDPVPGSIVSQIVGFFFIIFNYVSAYYTLLFFIFPIYWKNKKLLVAAMLFTLSVFFIIAYINYFYIIPKLGGTTYHAGKPIEKFFTAIVVLFLFIAYASFSFFINKINQEKLKAQADRERLTILKELNNLKNSFGASYTFDFLNYCYYEAALSSEKTTSAIALFSKMLKYSLTLKPDQEIPIQDEISYIKEFIILQKIVSTNAFVSFKYEVEENVKVLPRIFITIIENIFKHGVTNEANTPATIFLSAKPANIHLKIQNIKNHQKKAESTGVGMKNVQNILKLFYPGKYTLQINNSDTIYTCNLYLSI